MQEKNKIFFCEYVWAFRLRSTTRYLSVTETPFGYAQGTIVRTRLRDFGIYRIKVENPVKIKSVSAALNEPPNKLCTDAINRVSTQQMPSSPKMSE